MSTLKQIKRAERSAVQQQEVLLELKTIVKDIERCEKTLNDLQRELVEANTKYPNPRTTREDISYLNDLLKCAHKKLAWEKQIASLQKRTPSVLEKMAGLLNDPANPPPETTRAEMLGSLQEVQAAMERLQSIRLS